MKNALWGLKACHNTVRHLSSFFGCSSDFARLYFQQADVDACLELEAARQALLAESF